MKSMIGALLLSLAASFVQAQEARPADAATEVKKDDPTALDAKSIMLRADEAIKKVFYVKYDGLFQGTGFMVKNSPVVKGTAIERGKAVQGFGQYRFHVTEAKIPWDEKKLKFVSGYDGKVYYLLDPVNKIAYLQSSKDGLGSKGVMGDALGIQYFVHPEPYKDDLNAVSSRIRAESTVDNEPCWEIAISYQPEIEANKGKCVWFISKKDYLPRRMDRLFTDPTTGEVGTLQWIMTNLTTVPPKEDELTYTLPSGYTEKRESVKD